MLEELREKEGQENMGTEVQESIRREMALEVDPEGRHLSLGSSRTNGNMVNKMFSLNAENRNIPHMTIAIPFFTQTLPLHSAI